MLYVHVQGVRIILRTVNKKQDITILQNFPSISSFVILISIVSGFFETEFRSRKVLGNKSR